MMKDENFGNSVLIGRQGWTLFPRRSISYLLSLKIAFIVLLILVVTQQAAFSSLTFVQVGCLAPHYGTSLLPPPSYQLDGGS